MADLNSACYQLPAVVISNYKPKGKYEKLAGLDIYTTGNESSARGIIDVYDIFGLMPPTLQGADRLAESLDAVVLVPDFFKGEPLSLDVVPSDTAEKKTIIQKFMAEKANPFEAFPSLVQTATEAKEKYPDVQGWGVFGLCWGGKLAALASGAEALFKVSGTAHPGRLVKEDAEKMTIPHICLFSPQDGDPDLMKEYTQILKAEGKSNYVEIYSSMFHGWMGARANLENEDNAKEFERGYVEVANFFHKYL